MSSVEGWGGAERLRRLAGRSIGCWLGLAALLSFSPASAWALCPNCLGQTRSVTPTLELIGLFLLLPFVVTLAVFRRIRRLYGPAVVTTATAPKPSTEQG